MGREGESSPHLSLRVRLPRLPKTRVASLAGTGPASRRRPEASTNPSIQPSSPRAGLAQKLIPPKQEQVYPSSVPFFKTTSAPSHPQAVLLDQRVHLLALRGLLPVARVGGVDDAPHDNQVGRAAQAGAAAVPAGGGRSRARARTRALLLDCALHAAVCRSWGSVVVSFHRRACCLLRLFWGRGRGCVLGQRMRLLGHFGGGLERIFEGVGPAGASLEAFGGRLGGVLRLFAGGVGRGRDCSETHPTPRAAQPNRARPSRLHLATPASRDPRLKADQRAGRDADPQANPRLKVQPARKPPSCTPKTTPNCR
jgi:hypothetical protein